MHSSLVTKVEKAHRYARERDRFAVGTMAVTVKGDNDVHTIELSTDGWHCTCDYFLHHSACCHQLALQLVLGDMLPEGARESALFVQPSAL